MAWTTERESIQRETQRQAQARVSWDADVIVPAGQALLIGSGVGVGTFVLALAVTIWQGWRFWLPLAAGGASGGLAFAVASVGLTMDHRRLLWAAEAALGVDLDGDDVAGKPDPEILRVELLERSNGRQRLAYIDLPGDRSQLRTLALGLLNGRGTNQAQWTGTAGPFTRSEFEAIRAALIERNLANWIDERHHNQGWELNAAGRAIMAKLADRPTPEA